jgi:very-short-patch-repair endonuclease
MTIAKLILEKTTGYQLTPEFRFSERRWKFDFAHVGSKTAIEIEGGVFSSGRHTRGVGYINDMEKYNKAVELGWVVLRYTPKQVEEILTHEQIKNVIIMRLNIFE